MEFYRGGVTLTGYEIYTRFASMIPMYKHIHNSKSKPQYTTKEKSWDELAQKFEQYNIIPEEYIEYICKYIKKPYTSVILSPKVFQSFLRFRHTEGYTTYFLSKATQEALAHTVKSYLVKIGLALSLLRYNYLHIPIQLEDGSEHSWDKLLTIYSAAFLNHCWHTGKFKPIKSNCRPYEVVTSVRFFVYASIRTTLEKMSYDSLVNFYVNTYTKYQSLAYLTFSDEIEQSQDLDVIRKTFIGAIEPYKIT